MCVCSESGPDELTPPRAASISGVAKKGPHPSKLVDLGAASSYGARLQQPSAGVGTGLQGLFGDDPPPLQAISTQHTGSLFVLSFLTLVEQEYSIRFIRFLLILPFHNEVKVFQHLQV